MSAQKRPASSDDAEHATKKLKMPDEHGLIPGARDLWNPSEVDMVFYAAHETACFPPDATMAVALTKKLVDFGSPLEGLPAFLPVSIFDVTFPEGTPESITRLNFGGRTALFLGVCPKVDFIKRLTRNNAKVTIVTNIEPHKGVTEDILGGGKLCYYNDCLSVSAIIFVSFFGRTTAPGRNVLEELPLIVRLMSTAVCDTDFAASCYGCDLADARVAYEALRWKGVPALSEYLFDPDTLEPKVGDTEHDCADLIEEGKKIMRTMDAIAISNVVEYINKGAIQEVGSLRFVVVQDFNPESYKYFDPATESFFDTTQKKGKDLPDIVAFVGDFSGGRRVVNFRRNNKLPDVDLVDLIAVAKKWDDNATGAASGARFSVASKNMPHTTLPNPEK